MEEYSAEAKAALIRMVKGNYESRGERNERSLSASKEGRLSGEVDFAGRVHFLSIFEEYTLSNSRR